MTQPEDSSIIASSDSTVGTGQDFFESLVAHFSGAPTSEIDPEILNELRQELGRDHFSTDMIELWGMLDTVIVKAGGAPETPGDDVFRLLNLACGRCEEGAVLPAFFGRYGADVRQFAMDLRDHEIDKARRRYASTEQLFRKAGIPPVKQQSGKVEFVADDATKLVGYGQIPSEFEIVFIRHQNLWHDRDIWQRIYEFALARISEKGGLLVITSYFDREHLLALELLRAIGGKVLASEQNPRSRELDYPGKSIDRHVAAICRA